VAPRLDLIGIIVENMAASLAFYRRLGCDVPLEADTEDHVESVVTGMRVAWDTIEVVRSFDPAWEPPVGGQRIGLAFLCDSASGVDELYASLTAAGYAGHKKPWDAFWGQRYAVIIDPDGNPVDLFAPLTTD
jgi:catechol 2,3-dioxygenase-like lactoylglutathione lyase family enzyme